MEEKGKKSEGSGEKEKKKEKRRGGKWLLAITWLPNKHVETIMVFSQRVLDLESKENRFSLISDTYLKRDITFLSFQLHKWGKRSQKRLPLKTLMNYRTTIYH